jgi:hypothetical protein
LIIYTTALFIIPLWRNGMIITNAPGKLSPVLFSPCGIFSVMFLWVPSARSQFQLVLLVLRSTSRSSDEDELRTLIYPFYVFLMYCVTCWLLCVCFSWFCSGWGWRGGSTVVSIVTELF